MMERIRDSRAFMGALALLIVGGILTLMIAFYMLPEIFGDDILTARWWWEIVLNLQILCFAFMWFCHHERILQADGRWRLRAIGNFVVGMISAAYPLGVLLISAWLDWFRQPPGQVAVTVSILAGVAFWIVGAFLVPAFYWFLIPPGMRSRIALPLGRDPRGWLTGFWPTLGLVVTLFWEVSAGDGTGFILVPIFMYIQAALPYLKKAGHASPRDSDI